MPDQIPLPDADAAKHIQALLGAMPDGVVIVDRKWKFRYANQRAMQIVNDHGLIGEDIFERFPGNREEPFGSAYRKTMEERLETEFEAFHKEPLRRWLNVQVRPFHEGIIIFFSDVTERKETELREQETGGRLSQVLEVTSDAVLALDREWRFTYLNSNAERLIDPEKRLLGLNLWEEFPAVTGGPVWEIYHRSMNEGVAGHTEIFYPEPLNKWLAITSQPTPDGIVVFFRDITEQKTHDDVVGGQQELLAAVQSAAQLATWDLDLATQTIRFGLGSHPVLGHPLNEIRTQEAFLKIVPTDYQDALKAVIGEALRTGERFMMDLQVMDGDRRPLWIELRGQAVLDHAGQAVALRGMATDVSSRKRNEAALLASEERYRVLADLNPQAIWMGDAVGNITYANQGFLSYIGLAAENLSGMGWLHAFAPQDRKRAVEVWTRSVTTGVEYDIEAHLLKAETGEYRWWRLRAAPVRDEAGKILHWLGVAYDIHDGKMFAETLQAQQAETERRRAELETIYKTTPVGMALLDPVEFRFLNLNDHEAEMLGAAKDAILGRKLSEIAPPESMPGLQEMMQSVAEGRVIKERLLEGELAARPGERRAWSVNYSPVFNEDGSIRAISTASIEITNQKKAEAALIQSEKLAAVGRLASSISHEINNPLEAVTNLLYLVALDEELPEQLKVYVHMAQSEVSRVSQIATQTLRFHRQAVAPTLVTAQDLVEAVIRLYTGRLTNSNIKVDVRYDTETRILCFENDIRQVLNNLIANAIDAMRTGGRLVVRAHDSRDYGVPEGRSGVRITIADTGHGMSASVLKRVFEPFFTTKDLQGTGLGLWISAGIVQRHQGKLKVRSSIDPDRHGTAFTLFLPCEEVFTA